MRRRRKRKRKKGREGLQDGAQQRKQWTWRIEPGQQSRQG